MKNKIPRIRFCSSLCLCVSVANYLGILIAIGILLCVPNIALAATINVPADQPTIQAGIDAANAGDTIIVADGTYNETNIDFTGKAITVRSQNGPTNCIIDCQSSGRGFYFHSGETSNAVAEGFTIQNAYVTGGFFAGCGGGIFCDSSSSPTITNCTITGNSADYGGGVLCRDSSRPIITNCVITGNLAVWGGGIFCEWFAHAKITNCTITNNSAGGGDARGGGIYCYAQSGPTITNCTIANNTSNKAGGGIYSNWNSSPTLNNTILWGNSATSSGSQVYTNTADLTVTLNYCDYVNGSGDVEGLGTVTPNNCITLDPLFVDATAQDYHLQDISPCIDTGNNSYVTEVTDLDGNARIQNGTVDMGAYETAPGGLVPPSNFAGQGVATDKIEWTWIDDVPSADAYLLQDTGSGTIAMIPRPAVLYQETVVGENTQVTRQIRSCTTAATTALTVEPVGTVAGVQLPWNTLGYRAQYLYTAAELSNTAGSITKIYWQRLNAGVAASFGSVSVQLGHSTKNSLDADCTSNFDAGGPVQVRDPAAYAMPATGGPEEWVEIPLDRAFYYNGTDNLIIDINVPAGGSDNVSWSKVNVAGEFPSLYANPGGSSGVPEVWKFFLKVEREEVGSTSAPAGPVSVYTLVHDATVDNFSLSISGTDVVVTVTEPPNGHAGMTGVQIERADDSAFMTNFTICQLFTDNYSCTDTSTVAGNTYWYRIIYRNGDGIASAASAGESIFVPDPGTDLPPTAQITSPTSGTHSGDITITYSLRDVDSDPAQIVVEYSTDGGSTWTTATMGSGGDPTTPLTTSPAGTTHTYAWDTLTDGVGTSVTEPVQLRIVPSDKDGPGATDTSSFTVSNIPQEPPSVAITAPSGGTHSGDVAITYTLTDANSDTCSVTVEYTTDGGGTWQACTQGAGGDGTSGLDSSAVGTAHTFVWDSANDNVGTSAIEAVQVRITPHDGIASGALAVSAQFNVDNTGIIGPVANFTASTVTGDAPLTVQFTDTSTGVYDAWLWDFGDGGTSTQLNPAHTYNLVGTYTVTLIIDGPEGSDTLTRVDYITVTDPGTITAHFSGTPVAGSAPLDVQFTDMSVGDITSWGWDFGDGGTSSSQSPSHQYSSAGDYTVSLTVTGPTGSDTETRSGYISVVVTGPVANFTGSPATGDAPLAVQFTDTSTGTVTSWLWDFGDGGTSTQQSPSYLYRLVGIYTVTLTIDGPGGSDFMVATDYIAVTDPGTVAADFSAVPAAGAPPLDVQFTDMSVGNISSWAWAFGDGATSTNRSPTHQYVNAGTYTVTLTVSGPSGSDVQTRTDCVNVGAGAARRGGAIFCESSSSPTIINCVIKNCSADYGGAIACDNSSPAIVNCAIVNNSATNYGGGICSKNASPTIINCTITDNTAGSLGGGFYCEGSSGVTLENTIIWGNSASSQGNQIYIYGGADVVTLNYCNYAGSAGDIAGAGTLTPTNCITLDPLFVIGTKGSYYLSQVAAGQGSDSPCLDAGGDTAVSLGLNTKTTRTDGTTDTGTVDIGYHYEP